MRVTGEMTRYGMKRGKPWTLDAINSAFARLAKKIEPRYCRWRWRHSFGHRKRVEGLDSMVVATLHGPLVDADIETVCGHILQESGFLLTVDAHR